MESKAWLHIRNTEALRWSHLYQDIVFIEGPGAMADDFFFL